MAEVLSVRVKRGEKGKLCLPVSIRDKAGILDDDTFAVTVLEGSVIQLRSLRRELSGLQGKYKLVAGSV